jgi:chromosome segregation ATPase
LREAFEKRGQEIARLRLAIPSEKEEEFAEKQKKLKELRDRLAESEALLQLLDSSSSEVSREQLDQVYAKEREQLRKELSSRTDELKRSIADLEKEIGSGQVQYLKTLEEEREALARLIAVRREWLLAEYQSLSGCSTDDRSCVARKLKVLCRLSPLFPTGSRAPIITLIQDVSDQLHLGGGTTSSLCNYLSHDFGS